jgi:hypothetical protein
LALVVSLLSFLFFLPFLSTSFPPFFPLLSSHLLFSSPHHSPPLLTPHLLFLSGEKSHPYYVDFEGVRNVVDSLKALNLQNSKFILVSSLNVTRPLSSTYFFNNTFFGRQLNWKWEGEEHLRKAGLNYTIVRAGGLLETEKVATDNPLLVVGQGDLLKGKVWWLHFLFPRVLHFFILFSFSSRIHSSLIIHNSPPPLFFSLLFYSFRFRILLFSSCSFFLIFSNHQVRRVDVAKACIESSRRKETDKVTFEVINSKRDHPSCFGPTLEFNILFSSLKKDPTPVVVTPPPSSSYPSSPASVLPSSITSYDAAEKNKEEQSRWKSKPPGESADM